MSKGYTGCEATKFYDKRQMKVVRLSALHNGSIYTPWDIPITQFHYWLSRPEGHSVAERIISMKISKNNIGNRTRDFPAVALCLNQLRHRVPLIIISMLSKFCSLRCYSKFVTLFKVLFSTFSVMNDFVFTFFPRRKTSSLINFNNAEGSEWGAKNKNRQITEYGEVVSFWSQGHTSRTNERSYAKHSIV
jgi:hypothetical protein